MSRMSAVGPRPPPASPPIRQASRCRPYGRHAATLSPRTRRPTMAPFSTGDRARTAPEVRFGRACYTQDSIGRFVPRHLINGRRHKAHYTLPDNDHACVCVCCRYSTSAQAAARRGRTAMISSSARSRHGLLSTTHVFCCCCCACSFETRPPRRMRYGHTVERHAVETSSSFAAAAGLTSADYRQSQTRWSDSRAGGILVRIRPGPTRTVGSSTERFLEPGFIVASAAQHCVVFTGVCVCAYTTGSR